MSIVVRHKAVDFLDQVTHAAERAPADRPVGDEREAALHLIEPTRVGGRVMEVEAPMEASQALTRGCL